MVVLLFMLIAVVTFFGSVAMYQRRDMLIELRRIARALESRRM